MNDKNNTSNYINTFIFLAVKMILTYMRMLISIWVIYMYNILQTFLNCKIKSRFLSHLMSFIIMSTLGLGILAILMNNYNIDIYNCPQLFMYF